MIGLTIDPGMMTGVCLFEYGDDKPFTILQLWQFPGGAEGLRHWLVEENVHIDARLGGMKIGRLPVMSIDTLIVEKFTPRPDEKFNLTLEAVEPLRGEGVLIGRGFDSYITWREPSQQYFIGPQWAPLPEKKKKSHEFLETFGILPTGKQFNYKDANDAISTILHSIGWLRRKKHMPTLNHFFPRPEM